MSVIGSNILAGASSQGGYTIEESLRFNASQSSYLSWTPNTQGSATTWTWSAWIKRGTQSTQSILFDAAPGTTDDNLNINSSNCIDFYLANLSGGRLTTTQVLRDPSAWYHLVAVWDSTNATSSDRIRLYLNGSRITAFSTASYPSQNYALTGINSTNVHAIGRYAPSAIGPFDGYLTEVNFIDGQALTPSDFGEYNATTGVWQPVGYTGTYGTNGFYLPMKLDNTTEGFNTVTYIGNGSTNKISGVGFSPDLVWTKARGQVSNQGWQDTVRGGDKVLFSDVADAEYTGSYVDSFDSDGFTTKSTGSSINAVGYSYVAWCWDAGGTTVSNTDGSITSSVRANPAYGFSVVTYTGNYNGSSGTGTLGHGLNTTPSLVIIKNRDSAYDWAVGHSSVGWTQAGSLNLTNAFGTSSYFNSTAPTASVFSVGQSNISNQNLSSHVAYCFSEIAGYSKFGSYTGTGSSGNAVTTGFKPAFVMVKRTDGAGDWFMFDSTRDVTVAKSKWLRANYSGAEVDNSAHAVTFTDTGFQLTGTDAGVNGSGATYIYMAFKDTREYAFWLDDSGNNNDWQPAGGITTESTVTDTPTPYLDGGNYAVLNPLLFRYAVAAPVFSEANLKQVGGATTLTTTGGTIGVSSGKWYWEALASTVGNAAHAYGISTNASIASASDTDAVYYKTQSGGEIVANGVDVQLTLGAIASGDIIGIALDMDAREVSFYKNNILLGAAEPLVSGVNEYFPMFRFTSTDVQIINFGQRPFAYTPPTGFKSLHTGNLPDAAIENGSKYFNTVLYTGDGASDRGITGVGLQPDFTWIKCRSNAVSNIVFDSVRGVSRYMLTNSTAAEAYTAGEWLESFDADGFTVNNQTAINSNGLTYVAWNWKAGGAAVTNTAGSITSQVSASPTAGFSVVTYTEPSGTFSFGHGLGVTPAMVIIKNRGVGNWIVWHKSFATPPTTAAMYLNTTTAVANSGGTWLNSVSSTVVDMNSGQFTGPGTKVAYCFSEVPGYSKFGSYVGNGSADGPFVNLGFRARFILTKATQQGSQWFIWDTARELDNPNNSTLFPESSQAETSNNSALDVDVLSNGFKIRNTGSGQNNNGYTYIYMAFAENPFKNSLAR